jgi:putative membrane protein
MKPHASHHAEHQFSTPPRGVREYLGLVARGFCMGSADVVPGVSGGTMAFILGIYEELIHSIRMIGQPVFVRALVGLRLAEALRLINFWFLVSVGGGILLAILTLARGIEWMLNNQPIYIWSFFFGLVLASVIVVARRIARWNALLLFALVAGAIAAWLIVGSVPVETPEAWWFYFLAGAVAICAMILPGISGAFILVLLGKYQAVLSAVNQRDLVTIAIVGAGAVVGLVTFAQVLGWLFRRFHDITVAVLTGLMLGSLRKVWPWKVDLAWMIDRHGREVPTQQSNVLPQLFVDGAFNNEVLIGAVMALIGFVAVIALEAWANRKAPAREPGS